MIPELIFLLPLALMIAAAVYAKLRPFKRYRVSTEKQ